MKESPVKTYHQISAGGVVFRFADDGPMLAIIQTVDELRWQLPKGLIDDGETTDQAALREVREEAGVEAEIVGPVDKIEYWFYADYDGERRRYHKHVHFFLMKYLSGDVADHDHEVAEARWVNADEALKMLSFKSEREIVERAIRTIAALQNYA